MPEAINDISVVICCYTEERWDYIVQAIASVAQQTYRPREIIVVVDHNPSLLLRIQRTFENVKVVENSEPRGISGARNSGVAAAQGAILAFLDDDAVAYPDWLEHLLAAYTDPNVLGVGGTIDTHWETGRPSWFPEEFDWVVGCTYRGVPTTLSPVRNLIAANMSTRRAVFARVGNFQTGIGRLGKIPIGCEETEFCIRAYQQWPNGRFLYEPNARVYQHVPPARARWQYFQTRCYAEGISKAQVVKYVGSNDGLSSEWRYTFFVLPRGVVRGVIYAIAGDLHGLGRAAAIVAGLAITTYGYLVGTLQAKVAAWKEWLSQYNQSSRQTKASYVQKGG
jgi:glycosyltransferase involved in cell wall biosynthesis